MPGAQGAPERGFAMAMDALRGEHQYDSVVGVARDDEGRVRGFLHFVPTYGRAAVSLSFMRRDPETPNGLTEYLVARSHRGLPRARRRRGLAQLRRVRAAGARPAEPARARCSGASLSLANPFFQIESLYRFNAKFDPRWEPRYLLYEGRLGLARAGLAAAWAEGQMPKPLAAPMRLPRGLGGAARGRRLRIGVFVFGAVASAPAAWVALSRRRAAARARGAELGCRLGRVRPRRSRCSRAAAVIAFRRRSRVDDRCSAALWPPRSSATRGSTS